MAKIKTDCLLNYLLITVTKRIYSPNIEKVIFAGATLRILMMRHNSNNQDKEQLRT